MPALNPASPASTRPTGQRSAGPLARDLAVDDVSRQVIAVTAGLLEVMGVEGTVICRDRRGEESSCLWVEILSAESRCLIGERGAVLAALEHLLRIMFRPVVGETRVVVDVNAYRARRAEEIRRRARAAAFRAQRTRRAVILEPMRAADRRLVHLALVEESGITTESQGEDPYRRVVVRPADPLLPSFK